MYRIIGGDQKEYGPVSAEEVRLWITQRRLQATSLVRAEGTADWKPLSLFPEFSGTLASLAPAPTVVSQPTPQAGNNNGMAVTGLLCGVMAWPATCCCYGFPFNILGIIFSAIALAQLRHAHGAQGGRGMAIAGLVLSTVQLAILLGLIGFGVALNWSDIMREFKH
jgi:hypothetical protein